MNGIHVLRQAGTKGAIADETMDMINRQLKHVSRLIDDLFDVSRMSRGQLELRKQPVNLVAVAVQTVEACRPTLHTYGHELSVLLPTGPLWVDGDSARLEQMLSNLLTNAARDTGPNARIELTVECDGDSAGIRVRNPRISIAPQDLPSIFDLYKSWSGLPEGSGERLGIGLNLAKRLAEMHGGSVSASSEGRGQGSEFVVRLPLLPQQTEGRQPIAHAVGGGKLLRILVIEDNSDVARSLARLLRLWGHDIRVVGDGFQALSAAREHRPEIVLIDLGLPGLDGFQVAVQFRKDPELKLLRLVALTAFGDQAHQRRAIESGFDQHVTKPVDPTELRRLLDTEPAGVG
jgi:CheY-like chemotaxis protein